MPPKNKSAFFWRLARARDAPDSHNRKGGSPSHAMLLSESERRAFLTEQSNAVKRAMTESNAAHARQGRRAWFGAVLLLLLLVSTWRVVRVQGTTTVASKCARRQTSPHTCMHLRSSVRARPRRGHGLQKASVPPCVSQVASAAEARHAEGLRPLQLSGWQNLSLDGTGFEAG